MMWINGKELCPKLQQDICRAFVYRWTVENHQRQQAYVHIQSPNIPLVTDAEWIAAHAFSITKKGELSARHNYCLPAFLAD